MIAYRCWELGKLNDVISVEAESAKEAAEMAVVELSGRRPLSLPIAIAVWFGAGPAVTFDVDERRELPFKATARHHKEKKPKKRKAVHHEG